MAELNLDLDQSLQSKMAQFKSDPEKMQDVNDFLNDLFDKAQKEAEIRNGNRKGKLMELNELGLGLTEHDHKHAHLPPEYLQQYVIVQILYVALSLIVTKTNMNVIDVTKKTELSNQIQ